VTGPSERHLRILSLLTILLLVGSALLLSLTWTETPAGQPGRPHPLGESKIVRESPAANPPSISIPLKAAAASVLPGKSLRTALESMLAALRGGSPESNRTGLERLRQLLESAPPAEAIAAVSEFLKSRRDAPTGLAYGLGSGGRLETAPTLRAFLLDELGALCKRSGNSQAVLDAATDVLASPGSADEWSLALRNVAWADKNSNEFLNTKFREMFGQSQWLQNPSAGFLEALDIPVYTQDAGAIAVLAPYLQRQPEMPLSLSRATAIALDRLAEQNPLQVMNYLNSNPGVLSDMAMMRADYFSKASLSDPAQRFALETYFSRADVADEEKVKAVAGLFAPGSFVADTLLATAPASPDPALQMQMLNQVANDWSKRFPVVGWRVKQLLKDPN